MKGMVASIFFKLIALRKISLGKKLLNFSSIIRTEAPSYIIRTKASS